MLPPTLATAPESIYLDAMIARAHDPWSDAANEGFAASQRVWAGAPTAITVVFVAGLGMPDALVEIDAIAVVD